MYLIDMVQLRIKFYNFKILHFLNYTMHINIKCEKYYQMDLNSLII